MRVALGEHAHELAEPAEPGERLRARQEARGALGQRLDLIDAEVLVEPGAPDELQGVAGLQHTGQPRRAAAARQPKMPSMRFREGLDDDRGLAEALEAEDDAFVAPFQLGALRVS